MSTAQNLIVELQAGRIRSVAFVVPSDAGETAPLYDLAITTARRGWELGIASATYWFITPEPEPPVDLEAEGIVFAGSTYADVQGDVVLLDPQDEWIAPDRIVTLDEIAVDRFAIAA